jgi:hypothetical protein
VTDHHLFASLTRIADLDERPFDCITLPRDDWDTGDYIVARAIPIRGGYSSIELPNGRMADVMGGDRIVGALGERHATLEAVGSWRDVGEDGRMHLLTAAGLFGRARSVSGALKNLVRLDYLGHACRHGERLRMRDFVPKVASRPYDRPTILIVGTSMSAGKTTAAKVLIRLLRRRGLRVAGVKLTGAGRYRDVLAMRDAGARAIYDFVDVGLPSSIGPAAIYRGDLERLLGLVAASEPDIVVAEAGASPVEPYNGQTALDLLGDRVRMTVLCASDPYAVVGVMQGFGMTPDLVAGLATSTTAGVEVVERLSGRPAVNLLDPAACPTIEALLDDTFGRPPHDAAQAS